MSLHFSFDSMHIFMTLLAVFMWVMTGLASPEYFDGARCKKRYFIFWAATFFALAGVFLAADFITLFTFFEIMSFTSYIWVVQNETPEAIRAAETYLFIAVIGGLTMLMGLFLIYHCVGTLDFDELRALSGEIPANIKLVSGICILLGFGAKAGMFPLHIWLPKAHPVAPAPASALLSGILTKSGVFGIVALSCNLWEGSALWGNILLVCAVITMFLGALLAIFSTDLKRTLACSSMSQIGFILTGVAMCVLLGEHGSLAASGATLHILNHSLIKLTLFIAAGVVYFNVHSLDFNRIRGFGRGKILLMLAFLSGACSIAGIPGFGGYVSKTLLHESIVEYAELSGLGIYRVVEWIFLASGGMTLAYMSRLFYIIFMAPKADGQHEKEKYMGKATASVLVTGGILMPFIGLTSHATMDRIASFCMPFFRQHPMKPVDYFSPENLKGALISISIGAVVFMFAGMVWLTEGKGEKQFYRQVWPKWADLEDSGYRPFLNLLSFIGGALARAVETAGSVLILGPINLIFAGAKKKWIPPEDDFGEYRKERKHSIISKTFSSDLMFAALGIVVFIIVGLIRLTA